MMQIRENLSLRPYNTFGIDCLARYFSSFSTIDELREILQAPQYKTQDNNLVLGGGSNILFTRDFNGIILKNDIKGIDIVKEETEYIYVKAGAGENWHGFVLYCLQNNFAGVENLALIPGNVGASPMQNIGAYGVEIKDVFYDLEALSLADGTLRVFSLNDCGFGYRDSIFKRSHKNQYLITSVTYRLSRTPSFHTSYGAVQQELEKMRITDLNIKAIAQAIMNIRRTKLPDPTQIGNAGSFFKNPQISNEIFNKLKAQHPVIPFFPAGEQHTKVPAGWLIEQCGWKGYRKSDAGCFDKQALVLVNYGNATGTEIWNLSEEIMRSVNQKFGILLEREVNIV